jgi:hypothetical protein
LPRGGKDLSADPDPDEILALKREIEDLKQKNLRWQILVNKHVKK